MDKLTFEKENQARIQMVNNSFGPSVGSLNKPGRILMGEGRLLKQGRKKPQLKAFFLFNDVLVYGGILLNGRWFNNQKIIPLGETQVLTQHGSGRMERGSNTLRLSVMLFLL